MSHDTYMRAIAAFDALVSPPQHKRIASPAALIQDAGLPRSTGYRHLTSLEGAGLLSRDKTGAYVIGPAAVRIGLSARGVGRLAVLAPPILLRLREGTGRTVFLALAEGARLDICTLSTGRETRAFVPARSYHISPDQHAAGPEVADVYLRDASNPAGKVQHALLCSVPGTQVARIGMFSGSNADETEHLRQQLKRSADLFRVDA